MQSAEPRAQPSSSPTNERSIASKCARPDAVVDVDGVIAGLVGSEVDDDGLRGAAGWCGVDDAQPARSSAAAARAIARLAFS
jgi:hypothetical protein